jgi:hypothetical protein
MEYRHKKKERKEMLGEEKTRKTPKEKHHRTGGKQENKGFKYEGILARRILGPDDEYICLYAYQIPS